MADNVLVTKVILQDYGVYRGRNEFDFTCDERKPIILVGGTNGAGKTTLFESIMLCLYGISSMAKRSTKKSYEKFLERKIHRYAKGSTSADHASVVVQFKFFHNGQETEYRVERSWRKEEGSIIEQLGIKKRTSVKDEFGSVGTIEKSYWQSFIEDLIPKGIVRLFFFDGEKIVKMAKEDVEDITIRNSFRALLGIEIVEQLRADLQVNLTRNLTGTDKALQEDFEKLKAEKGESTKTVSRLLEKQAQKQTELDRVQRDIDTAEASLTKIGGGFASGRDDAKTRLAVKKADYENLHQKIEELCAGILPFSLIPGHLENLSEQIRDDEAILQQQMGQKLLQKSIAKIKSSVKKPEFWNDVGLDAKHAKTVTNALSDLLDIGLDRAAPVDKPVLELSTEQVSRISEIIRNANTVALDTLSEFTQKITLLDREITYLETSLVSAPNDDEIGSLVKKIGELNSDAGMLRSEMDHIQEKISSNTSLKQHLDAKLRDIISQIYKNKRSQKNVELTQNVQKTLDEFIEKLKIKKVHLLEQYLLDAVKILMHKRHLIEHVRIDPETFEVTLFGKDEKTLPKDMLSEGEKQMFAMSVLWALAKTSGRPLPFIIDTPLARLDEGHRTNIVERFLPLASHQIMIFSTDTEIENKDYQKLEPYMTRAYAMEYLEDEGFTKRHDGYFWNKEGEKIVAV